MHISKQYFPCAHELCNEHLPYSWWFSASLPLMYKCRSHFFFSSICKPHCKFLNTANVGKQVPSRSYIHWRGILRCHFNFPEESSGMLWENFKWQIRSSPGPGERERERECNNELEKVLVFFHMFKSGWQRKRLTNEHLQQVWLHPAFQIAIFFNWMFDMATSSMWLLFFPVLGVWNLSYYFSVVDCCSSAIDFEEKDQARTIVSLHF